ISDGNKQLDMKKSMLENQLPLKDVYKYHQVRDEIKADKFKVLSKKELITSSDNKSIEKPEGINNGVKQNYPQCDYAIITALEDDEMEKILPFIHNEGKVENNKHLIAYGHLKGNLSK